MLMKIAKINNMCFQQKMNYIRYVLTEKLTNSDEMFDALKINAEKDVNENCKN